MMRRRMCSQRVVMRIDYGTSECYLPAYLGYPLTTNMHVTDLIRVSGER
jgi:hypothetical protein